MVRILVLFIVVTAAACGYKASFEDCVVRCTSNECPSGYTCTGGLCSANGQCGGGLNGDADVNDTSDSTVASDVGCAGDMDCDGVPDAIDNCKAVANLDQHDEDGDGIGDVCDLCPISTNNADADSDGVGDDCDPNNNPDPAAADKILLFTGFSGGTIPLALTQVGSWTAGTDPNGDVIATGTTATPTSLTVAATASKRETVTASFAVATVGSTGPIIDTVGVVDDFSHIGGSGASGEQGVDCGIAVETAPPTLHLSPIDGTPLSSQSYEMMVGDTYIVTETRNGTAFDCKAERPIPSPPTMREGSGNSSHDTVSARVGLRVAGDARVRYQWVMIVASP